MSELCERAARHLPEGFAPFTFFMFFVIVGLILAVAMAIGTAQE